MIDSVDLRARAGLAKLVLKKLQLARVNRIYGSREDVLSEQRKQFRAMFEFAISSSPFYRMFYGDHGLLERKDISVEDLPVLTKELLMTNFDDIVTDGDITLKLVNDFVADGRSWKYDDRYLFIKSTGTSGYHTLNVLSLDEFSEVAALLTARSPLNGISHRRRAYVFGKDPSHLSYKFSCVSAPYLNEARHVPTQQSIGNIVRDLNEYAPDLLSSFPSTLRVLVEEAKAGRLSLPAGLTVLSSGEMLDQQLSDDCKRYFGNRPINIFACIEASPVAQDCREGHLHVNDDFFIVEPAADGGLITNLLNKTIPVMRFRFDDMYELDTTKCECGSCLSRLRISDAKRTGQFFVMDATIGHLKKVNTMIFKDVLYKYPDVIQSQIEQTSPNRFLIRVYAQQSSLELKESILTRVCDELRLSGLREEEADVELEFSMPSNMSAKNGKIKHFIPWQWSEHV